MPKTITAVVLKAAFRKHRDGGREDIRDAKVTGLELRVKPRAVRWSVRCRLQGRQVRFDLGPAIEGDEDIEGVSLQTARERATRVIEMARRGHNPESFVRALSTGLSPVAQEKADAARPKASWTWEDARTRFLAEVERTNRGDTLRDYRGKLQPAELKRFEGRMVATIKRNEMAAAIEDIHRRGKESMAAGVARVVKRFFAWLSEPAQQDKSNVADGVMVKLKAPPPTRAEIGQPTKKGEALDEDDENGDAPPEIEIGRALLIARSGFLPERIGLGLQLLIGTCQRRRTVTGAHDSRFRTMPMYTSEHAWLIPPYFRKSGTKRGRRSHLVPVVGFAAEAVTRLEALVNAEGGDGWLFPVGKTARADRPHAASDLFNDYLDVMPGVNWTPHAIRYALATYGERDLGFAKSEAKIILDHMEGTETTDVTGAFYSSDPAIARKRAMLRAWTSWCDGWAAKASAADVTLLDREHMMATMFAARYGEEQLEKRIAYRAARRWPLWGPNEALIVEEELQAGQ
ncbi:hypothetical protein SAMN05216374_3124 [Tardiphaga sp. OK246]|uniref:Arm DNA-binding domain-containing protein n=1 Tax=Tardiphaga sp. OK246 TaxID=1855307 RepID=UPI000B67C6E0|nr:Arm DNA-binding domain-containing protein [Tardiphaga sp. OK246]SNT31747.1 hypothetical protein SAMN05216374_3124 [Tardiphaga sp. OK246]